MTEKDIAIRLIQNAINKQKSRPDDYTEANEDLEVKSIGNAAIANSLEFLGRHEIVADVQPTISQRGIGFAYRIHPRLIEELSSDDLISRRVESLFEGPASETSATLTELLKNCERVTISLVYRDDLLASIKELRICFSEMLYCLLGSFRQDSGDMPKASNDR
jgi:hypothetical protein